LACTGAASSAKATGTAVIIATATVANIARILDDHEVSTVVETLEDIRVAMAAVADNAPSQECRAPRAAIAAVKACDAA
jgi:hypothetical protein